jgi:hypothetical protein
LAENEFRDDQLAENEFRDDQLAENELRDDQLDDQQLRADRLAQHVSISETHLPNDTRSYIPFTPPGEHRLWYRCGCNRRNAEGHMEQCQYAKRGDRHFRALRQHKLHDCVFGPVSGPLDRMVGLMENAAPTEMWDEIIHFAVGSNMSIEAAASPSFRSVIHTAFQAGFQRALGNAKADLEAEFKAFCPRKKATALRKCFIHAADADRIKLEQPLVENKFAAMTMDAGQIGSTKLFVTNLVASHLRCCFTSGISDIDAPQNHESLCDFLASELAKLANEKGIHVSVVICDGATYQTKALNWEDPESLQGTHQEDPLLSRVLFVPCLCHRLNNAYRRLVHDSELFGSFISDLRRLAMFCRKPKWRRQIGGNCPEFIETRWLYDHRILQFLLSREHEINALHKEGREVTALFHDFMRLLARWYDLVTVLEGSACRLAAAYMLISNATLQLAIIGSEYEDHDVSATYSQAVRLINQYTIDSASDILQLAYVLTPAGHHVAYKQLHTLLGQEIPDCPSFELEMVDFACQLADHDIKEVDTFDEEEGDDPPELSRDDVGETGSEIFFEDVSESFRMEVPAADFPSHYLPHRARAGLARIIRQFGLGGDEKTGLERAFHQFLTSPDSRVGVRVGFDPTRYLWLSAQTECPEYSVLAEIALRLEPAICSEAPSERAIGQQRRYLTPHRTRTKTDLLLARTEMEDYQEYSKLPQ